MIEHKDSIEPQFIKTDPLIICYICMRLSIFKTQLKLEIWI